jgi:hypothetical protein
MPYSYTRGRRRTCFPSRFTQKCFTPTLGENTKNIPYRFPPNKCSKFLCYLSIIIMQKRGIGYAKVIHKKELRKNGQVSE